MSNTLLVLIANLFLFGSSLQKISLNFKIEIDGDSKVVYFTKTFSNGPSNSVSFEFPFETYFVFKSNIDHCFKNFIPNPFIETVNLRSALKDKFNKQIVLTEVVNVKSPIVFVSCLNGNGIAILKKIDAKKIVGVKGLL